MRLASPTPWAAWRLAIVWCSAPLWAAAAHAQARPGPTVIPAPGSAPAPASLAAPVMGGGDSRPGQAGALPAGSPAIIASAPAMGSLLVYKREVFLYTRAGVRDPVSPPPELVRRDRFPALTLAGILYDAAVPESSAAILVIRRVTPDGRVMDGKAERKMVRAGDRVNAFRVVTISPAAVVVDKEILGTVERITLKKATRREAAAAPSRAAIDITLEPPPVRPRRPTGVLRPATPAPRDSSGATPPVKRPPAP